MFLKLRYGNSLYMLTVCHCSINYVLFVSRASHGLLLNMFLLLFNYKPSKNPTVHPEHGLNFSDELLVAHAEAFISSGVYLHLEYQLISGMNKLFKKCGESLDNS